MVVPGLLESLSGAQPGSRVRKSEWRSALEFIVEKMGAENLRITQLRLGTAVLWSFVTCCTIYRCWDMAQLRWVLMFHHLLAAAGLDEGLLMSFSATEPFLQRLLRPGSPVTPWMPGLLPRTQTVLGACVYASFLLMAIFQLITYRVSDEDVMIFTGVFLLACTFETDAEFEGAVLRSAEGNKRHLSHRQDDFPCQVNEIWMVLRQI